MQLLLDQFYCDRDSAKTTNEVLAYGYLSHLSICVDCWEGLAYRKNYKYGCCTKSYQGDDVWRDDSRLYICRPARYGSL